MSLGRQRPLTLAWLFFLCAILLRTELADSRKRDLESFVRTKLTFDTGHYAVVAFDEGRRIWLIVVAALVEPSNVVAHDERGELRDCY